MQRLTPLLLAPLLLVGSGCAFGGLHVKPTPWPTLSATVAPSAPRVLVAAPFEDARPDRTRCGMKKNSYNMDTARALCTVPPAESLSEHLAAALHAEGFVVQTQPDPTAPAALEVRGTLLQFFVEPKVEAFTFDPEADIHVRLRVTSPSGLQAERSFSVKGKQVAFAGVDEVFQAAVDQATRQVVADMVAALRGLLERYPHLRTPPGARPASALLLEGGGR